MAIEDLDLEFEEEGEKNSGIIEIDEELSFNAGSVAAEKRKAAPVQTKPKASAPSTQPSSAAPKKPTVSALEKTNPNLVIPKNLNDLSSIEPTFNNPISNDDKVKDLKAHRQKRAEGQSRPQTPLYGANEAYDLNYASSDEVQFLREEVDKLRKEMADVKVEAEVRARVAEEKAKFMIEAVTEAKMMNHQMIQILQRINTKVPGLKNEVLMAKKILDEFMKKQSK